MRLAPRSYKYVPLSLPFVNKISRYGDIWALIVLAVISLIFINPLRDIFFQADEWYLFGKVISVDSCGAICLIRPFSFHFVPLSWLIYFYAYKFFQLDVSPYIIFTCVLYVVNSLLMYSLCREFFSKKVSFISTLFFLTYSQSSQVVTWIAASLVGLPATFFLLFSLLLYRHSGVGISFRLIISYILLLLGLFLKEDVIIGSIIFFYYETFISKDKTRSVISVIFLFMYLFIRFGVVYFLFNNSVNLHFVSLSPLNVLKNLSNMPFSLLSSFIFPDRDKLYFGQLLGDLLIKLKIIPSILIKNQALFNEYLAFYIISPLLGLIILFLASVSKIKERLFAKRIIVLILISAVPYLFLPVNLRLESRHYYIASIGMTLLLAIYMKEHMKRISYSSYIMCTGIFLIILRNILYFQNDIRFAVGISKDLSSYVQALVHASPFTTNKTIIVNIGDSPPLYSGVGYVSMVINSNRFKYNDFFKQDILWNWGSEGYYEHGDVGFGFYLSNSSYSSAKELPADAQIITLNWDNKTHETKVQSMLESSNF